MPSIVAWPGHLQAAHSDYMSGLVDYFPTVMDMLGIDASSVLGERPMDGISLYPVLKGEDGGERASYLTVGYMRLFQDDNGIAIIENRYKLLRPKRSENFELYDLENDPAETTNLAGTMPDKVRELSATLDAWTESAMQSLKGSDYRY